MKIIFVFFLLLGLAMVSGCGSGSGGNDDTFLSVSKQTLPVIRGSTRAMHNTGSNLLRVEPDWMTWGDMGDEAAFIFLDPAIYEADGYSLGVNNIYHLLNDFGEIPSAAGNSFTSVTSVPWFEDHDVTSNSFFPTAFSKSYTELQSDQNYVAKSGNVIHMMRSFTGGGGSRASSVFQVIYDSTTSELQARFQGAWDYTADFSNAFVMRFEFFGKPSDHTFTLRATKWNSSPGSYYIQILGKGVSQGAGNYFLFKIRDNSSGGGSGTTLGSANYFCFDASTGTATDVSSTIGSSSCAEYQTAVDAITGIVYSDMPTIDVFSTSVTTQ